MSPDPVEPENVDPDVDLRHPPHFTGNARTDTWRTLVVVAVGGGIGALARLAVNTLLPRHGAGFPWATFGENVLGCLLIGVLMVVVTARWPAAVYPHHHLVRPFLGTGVLGGFTTFSAYTSDTRALLSAGQPATATLYLVASVAAGLLAVVAGMALARSVLPVPVAR